MMVEVQSKGTEGFLIASEKGIIGKLQGEPQTQTDQCPSKELQPNTQCPDCGSYNINRNGFRRIKDQAETQVFKCKECGLRFSEKYYRCKGQHRTANYALCKEAKKLDAATENTTVAGDEKNIKGKLLEFHVKMKLRGYKDATIRLNQSALNTLVNKGADLTDSESVKKVISMQSWSGNRIRNVRNAYTSFLLYLGLTWEPPRFTVTRKIPFIPTEQEIDDLIAAAPHPLAPFLQLLKETAMRRGEAMQIPWKDVDLERKIIMCNCPEKGSNAQSLMN